ncbi:MAG: CoA ester lyase [Alphaproteobacteria bacterium HGW-Alphaproteobacteria-5]|nr:MAG: CoA ester lyase [Alphaproteobacteria bacterium HGW-Alphaproteobacteria-5]
MTRRPSRLRRSQLAVPGSSEKMLTKGAASNADHVFCDLEDAVAPSAKVAARDCIAEALNTLDWGKKTRCVRVNDVGTQWCYEDIITILEKAGGNVDTIMLPKPFNAADVLFADKLIGQLEKKLKLKKRIGLEVLIEEVEALQNVEEIAMSCDRLEALIFGMGDFSASMGIDVRSIGGDSAYPGDIFHYPRFRITMAARAAGIDAIDGPFANFKDSEAYTEECRRALALGMVGKWAIHPAQIDPAIQTFTPDEKDVARAREMAAAYAEAEAKGIGSVNVNGMMVDVASIRLLKNTLDRADLIGM